MDLQEVTDKVSRHLFSDTQRVLYADDPLWIPPLKQDVNRVFDPRQNKLFKTGELTRWVLVDGAKPVGRIAAFVNGKTANKWDQPTGGIGFFECIDDQVAADVLFDTARDWLTARGMKAMDGPINFGERNLFWGLLAENFTDPPTYGMNHNPRHYIQLFENYGFRVFYKQLMYHRSMYQAEPAVFEKADRLVSDFPKARCTNARGMRIGQMASAFMEVYNAAWGGHEGVEPINYAQAFRGMKSIKPVMDRDIILFAWDGERPIGFYTNLPELNQIFRHVPHGNMNLIGKLIFLWHKWRHTSNRMYGLVFGVVPDYQGKGVEALMIRYASEHILPLNRYKDTVLAWIGDFNPKMIRICENLGCTVWRVFHTYRYLFDRDKHFERHPMLG
jgi:hypothetical protein